jgi:sugar phosphate isomerase/epimerase
LHFAPPADPAAAPWHFAAVGDGHDESTWGTLIQAVAGAGYDGVISIENEDPRYDEETATQRSFDFLDRLLERERTGR